MAALEHRDTGPEPGRLQGDGEPGQPGPDHTDVGVEIERQLGAVAKAGFVLGHACESLAHVIFLKDQSGSCHLVLNRRL